MEVDVPKTQLGAVFDKPNGPIEIREIPVPEPDSEDILVRLQYSGVCHSDLHIWQGEFTGEMKLPLVGGHEGAGTVVKIGSHVKGWKIGDRAGVKVGFFGYVDHQNRKDEVFVQLQFVNLAFSGALWLC